jgi:hypothetical protein
MRYTFVFCSNFPEYKNNQIRSPDLHLRYPGVGWTAEFAKLVEAYGCDFITSDIAFEMIRSGQLRPESVLIISEQNSGHAVELQRLGAVSLAIFCLESPLFAGKFYESIREVSSPYKVRIFFQGAINEFFPSDNRCSPVHFPSFHGRQIVPVDVPWAERKNAVMIAGNKYWRTPFTYRFLTQPKHTEAWLRGKLHITTSPVKKMARLAQLHDRRLKLIEFFGSRGFLDLYGAGWHDPRKLPRRWRNLRPLLKQLNPRACENKFRTMANYRFCFCLENIVYPGYVTEKIIDCLVVGVVPLYLGAPDIVQFVPENCFIDLRRFSSHESLERMLCEFDEIKAKEFIRTGLEFLHSEEGYGFTYEGFAQKLLTLVSPHISL